MDIDPAEMNNCVRHGLPGDLNALLPIATGAGD
jgi:hypothetical protein